MSNKAFRFAVTCTNAANGTEWKEKAQRAEELGYSTLLIPDHFIGQIAAMPALATAAAVTSSLRVGSIVLCNDFRHPILLAKEAATIDMLSNGRFELGLGAGWMKSEYDALGLNFDAPDKRVSRLEEAIQLLKVYFRDEPIDFRGQFYQVNNEHGLDRIPAPAQKPHPPLMIGAGGKKMLSIAARHADIISLTIRTSPNGTGPDPSDAIRPLEQKINWVRAAAPDRFDKLEFNVQTWAVVVTDNRGAVFQQLQKQFPLPLEILMGLPYLLVGTLDEITSQIIDHRTKYGISYFAVFEQYMDQFAPIINRLSGK